jgi:hypothetical protein
MTTPNFSTTEMLILDSVGKFVVAALKHPKIAMNRALKVQSFVASMNEIVAEFEKQTHQKWKINHFSLAELREHERKQWEEKNPNAPLYTLRRIWIEGGTLYNKTDNEDIEVIETESLAKAVAGELKKGGGQAIRSGQLQ